MSRKIVRKNYISQEAEKSLRNAQDSVQDRLDQIADAISAMRSGNASKKPVEGGLGTVYRNRREYLNDRDEYSEVSSG